MVNDIRVFDFIDGLEYKWFHYTIFGYTKRGTDRVETLGRANGRRGS